MDKKVESRPLGWATLEESKKLLEAGLSPDTSDMYYWCGSGIRIGGYKAQDKEFDIPCWSLGALIELLPNSIRINNYDIFICLEQKNVRYVYFNQELDMNVAAFIGENDNLIGNIVDAIIWLLGNGYSIKKGGNIGMC